MPILPAQRTSSSPHRLKLAGKHPVLLRRQRRCREVPLHLHVTNQLLQQRLLKALQTPAPTPQRPSKLPPSPSLTVQTLQPQLRCTCSPRQGSQRVHTQRQPPSPSSPSPPPQLL